ncbi:MAG: ClpXP protease specificity-enhancing factor, partial [Burkholderiaceae bacterium]|nr:ClpXP protease specificity-enhancing factor [Burkholderiaceae bacterium]
YARENGQGMAFPPPVDNLVGGDVAGTHVALANVLASSDADAPAATAQASEDRVVQLVTVEDDKKDDGGDAPRPPPAAGGARPSLKRIK